MDDFRKFSQKYLSSWNFPNCVGAIDGKHIRIKSPKNSGSLYFNYKEFYSIIMLAIVDADLKFAAIDVGSYGREGDTGIYLKSNFGTKIINNEFNTPPPQALPQTNTVLSPHPDRTGQKRATVQSGRLREYGGEFPGGGSP
jgi:hypothetical protein